MLQLHELLSYLAHCGVLTIMTMAQHGLVGQMQAVIDISYLADAVMLYRYFEDRGRLGKCISMLKKRTGVHENTLRELTIGAGGVQVGPPLKQLLGVLTGVPHPIGDATVKIDVAEPA